MKPTIILYDKTSLRSCNLLDVFISGITQSFENCVFAKVLRYHAEVRNHSNKSISCIVYKDANAHCITKNALASKTTVLSKDNLLQEVHTPQQFFCADINRFVDVQELQADENYHIITIS